MRNYVVGGLKLTRKPRESLVIETSPGDITLTFLPTYRSYIFLAVELPRPDEAAKFELLGATDSLDIVRDQGTITIHILEVTRNRITFVVQAPQVMNIIRPEIRSRHQGQLEHAFSGRTFARPLGDLREGVA